MANNINVKHHDEPFRDIRQFPYFYEWSLWLYLINCAGFQALIQYETRQSAVTARGALQVVLRLHELHALFVLLTLISFFLEWWWLYFWNFSRDAMFMMVAVSWTFSSQSRLKLSLCQQFHYMYYFWKKT